MLVMSMVVVLMAMRILMMVGVSGNFSLVRCNVNVNSRLLPAWGWPRRRRN